MSKRHSTWRSDPLQSYAMGRSLCGLRVERAEHELHDGPAWLALWAEIVFVSICHQTNWDQLHAHIMQIARNAPDKISPSSLRMLSIAETGSLLADGLEAGPARSRRDLAERRRLLVSLGDSAHKELSCEHLNKWGRDGVRLMGDNGVYASLDTVPAFSEDPLRKKARVLVHQLAGFGLVDIADPENMAPAIDYHLIRLYMRTNRIHPVRGDDYDKFSIQRTASQLKVGDIRQAVEEAMYYTAAGADLRIDQLNHVEWQIARSFCVREAPRCDGGPLEEKPIEETLSRLSVSQGGCPVRGICRGRQVPFLRRLQDPSLSKSFY